MKNASAILYMLQGVCFGGAVGMLLQKVYKIDTLTTPISFSTILLFLGLIFLFSANTLAKKSIKH